MNINLTPIIQAIIALLAALITYKLIPWIKSKTTKQQQENLHALIRVLVYAAEQLYGAGNGPEKLEYVCRELRERGYEVDLPEIEATVYQAFNYNELILRPITRPDAKADENKADEQEDGQNEQEDKQAEQEVTHDHPPDAE